MLRVTSLLGLGVIMWLFKRLAATGSAEAQATLALGFLLLAAYLGGLLARQVALPRITGYLLTGFLAGPALLHFVTEQDVGNLRLIGDIAIALIALAAGGELRVAELKTYRASIVRLGARAVVFPFVTVGVGVLAVSRWFPLTAGLGARAALGIALLLGVIAASGSPAVVLAVLTETGSTGRFGRTILTVSVVKDVTVIILFAASLNLALMLAGSGPLDLGFLADVGRRIGLSIFIGWVMGWLVSQYLKYVERQMVLFTIGVAFVSVELARLLDLEAMLLTLTTGFFIENVSPVRGTRFVRAIEQSSMAIYAVFFALAGAAVHLAELVAVWPWALLLVALRAGSLVAACRTGAEPGSAVARYGWSGFVSQAGVALGLAVVIERSFPDWGPALATMVVAVIAIHELIGPVCFRWGLGRSGEVRPETVT